MELYQLRTFLVVAEEQSITRAAKRLFTTPPSVSGHIKALEDEWNVALFRRTARGMEITEKGEQLRQKAIATLASAQDLSNHATNLRGHLMGAMRIGLNGSSEALRISAILRRLQDQSPGIEISLAARSSGLVVSEVKNGALDAGFAFEPVRESDLCCEPLSQVPLAIVIPLRWPKAAKAPLPELAALPWIYTSDTCPFQASAERLLGTQGLQPASVIRADDDQTRLQLVAAGMGIALIARSDADSLVSREKAAIWHGDKMQCQLVLVYQNARKNDPLIRAVRLAVLDIWNVAADLAAAREKSAR